MIQWGSRTTSSWSLRANATQDQESTLCLDQAALPGSGVVDAGFLHWQPSRVRRTSISRASTVGWEMWPRCVVMNAMFQPPVLTECRIKTPSAQDRGPNRTPRSTPAQQQTCISHPSRTWTLAGHGGSSCAQTARSTWQFGCSPTQHTKQTSTASLHTRDQPLQDALSPVCMPSSDHAAQVAPRSPQPVRSGRCHKTQTDAGRGAAPYLFQSPIWAHCTFTPHGGAHSMSPTLRSYERRSLQSDIDASTGAHTLRVHPTTCTLNDVHTRIGKKSALACQK